MKTGKIVPGKLITPGVNVTIWSDWCWVKDGENCREIETVFVGDVCLCLALVSCGWPSKRSMQALVLTPRGTFGWQSPAYFTEVT